MSDAISAETTVEVDYSSLVQTILEEASSSIEDLIDDRVSTYLSDNVGEAVDDHLRYNADISEMVNDCVGEVMGSEIEGLLDAVTPSSLCSLGRSFADAITIVLTHHITNWEEVFEGKNLGNGNGASSEDLQKIVADKFNKEMKIEVTFVDKEPAAIVSGSVV